MLSENLKEILNRFPEEKEKPIKDNEFAKKIRGPFTNDLNQIILDIVGEEFLWEGKMSPGSTGWRDEPWAGIKNYRVAKNFKTGLYLIYIINIENSKVYFSLDQGHDKFPNKTTTEIAEELVKKIDFELPDGFATDRREELNHSSIMFKVYEKDDLIEGDLIKDLEKMIEIYRKFIPIYIDTLDEMGLEPKYSLENSSLNDEKVISLENRNIWRISVGETNISEVWKEFKYESYIAIGNLGTEKEIDYNDFINEEKLNDLILTTDYNGPLESGDIWNFVHEINKGDIILVNKGKSNIVGIGIIIGDYIPETLNESKNSFGLNHIRKVKWILTDEFKVRRNLVPKTILNQVESNQWNEIISYYSKNNEEFRKNILKYLYLDFKENYQDTSEGKEHLEKYELESAQLNFNYYDMLARYTKGENISNDIWQHMISPKGGLFAPYNDPKELFKKRYGYSDDELEEVALLFFDTIKQMVENRADFNKQNEILSNFDNNELSKGFKTGVFAPSLYFLDNDFYIINKKSIDTTEFLSNLIGNKVKINNSLLDYVKNNTKLHIFLVDLSEYIPDIIDYRVFDEFCHWLCSSNLGNYAKGRKLPLVGFGELQEESEGETKINTKIIPSLNINPSMLDLHGLKISDNILYRICGALNANKNIILDGAPGTGKTELAISFSKAAQNENFISGYILTTATSDWTTFDTIGGFMPRKDGLLYFNEGKFLEAIRKNKWLIIDEINRSDIDKAFGQLFTVLSGQDVDLPYKDKNGNSISIKMSKTEKSYYDDDSGTYYIGTNWRIFATMNVYDKDSLFDLSYAFMRRFTFITIGLPEDFEDLIDEWGDMFNLEKTYMDPIKILLSLNDYRHIGPAIFKDMMNYIKCRSDLDDNYTDLIIEEAILSYVIPQFEGLSPKMLEKVDAFLDEKELNTENIKSKLKEFSGVEVLREEE